MRFYEFKINEAEAKPGYYVIGDSHAVGVANGAGKPWINTGVGGRQADNSEVKSKISQITPGSVVVVAAGANDTANSFKAAKGDPSKLVKPEVIAGRVASLVNAVRAQKPAKVILLVFPNGPQRTSGMAQWYNGDYQEEVRTAIKNTVKADEVIDQSDYKISSDGIHLSFPEYARIGKKIVTDNPLKDVATTDGNKGAETTEIKSGPPYPPEDYDKVKALQKALQDIGYSVGSTGIDGKYGPRTANAVRAFKKDYNVAGDALTMDAAALATLDKIVTGKIAKVKEPTQVNVGTTVSLPPLAQDAVTQGKVGEVLNLIAGPESRGRYDAVYPSRTKPEILDMTIDELIQDMKVRGRASGSSASGRYQFIRTTLEDVVKSMGLNPATTKFDAKTQDALAIHLMRRDLGLDNWLAGRMSNEVFLDRLSRVWAGLPSPSKGGASFYAGVLDNKAGLSTNSALQGLAKIQGVT